LANEGKGRKQHPLKKYDNGKKFFKVSDKSYVTTWTTFWTGLIPVEITWHRPS